MDSQCDWSFIPKRLKAQGGENRRNELFGLVLGTFYRGKATTMSTKHPLES
jgi:hypothetical protein